MGRRDKHYQLRTNGRPKSIWNSNCVETQGVTRRDSVSLLVAQGSQQEVQRKCETVDERVETAQL